MATVTPTMQPLARRRTERGSVAVLVPAHNEAEQLADTLDSLLGQTRPPAAILVISDNSTDATVAIARGYAGRGVEVIETAGNTYRKAGALNAGVEHLLAQPKLPEFIVTIDADTMLEEHFIQYALAAMRADPRMGGLSAVCRGKPNLGQGKSWFSRVLLWYQRAEYVRAGFVRIRRNVHTLSGAGSVLRMRAVLQVLAERGQLYELRRSNIVEDFETTLAIKRLGWKCTNNFYTIAYTDLMPTLPTLLKQRLRWVGGTIHELRRRGWRRETWQSIAAMIYGFVGVPVFYLWLALLAHNLWTGVTWDDLWYLPFVAGYQAVTIRKLGLWSMFVGFLLVPEVLYMLLRHSWLFASLVRSHTIVKSDWEGSSDVRNRQWWQRYRSAVAHA